MKARKRYRQRIRVPGLLLLVVIIAAVAIITGCMRKTETDARTSSANLTTAEALRTEQEKESRYQAALEMMEKEEYKEALDAFRALGDYQNAASLYENCCEQYKIVAYDEAIQLITGRQYSQALSILSSIEELDSDYEGVSVLSNYCNNCKLLENINNALDKGYAKQALDMLEVFPDCTERAEAYYRLKDLAAMNTQEFISITNNKAVFDERYPSGSFWVIEGSFRGINGNKGSYYLELYSSEQWVITCYGIDDDQLKEVRDDDCFVICGEFSDYDNYALNFDNCRILSEASNNKLSGVFKSDQSLSRVTGAEEYLRQYIEKAGNNNESMTKSSDLENGQQNTNTEMNNRTKGIELRYYSVDLPVDWMERVYVNIDEADKSISFNEKKNYDADYGGFLSYICLMLEAEEEEYGYEHTVLGTLTSPNGNISYYVVADLPGDVPYDYDNSSLKTAYLSAQEGLEAVYASIKGINGWKYIPE